MPSFLTMSPGPHDPRGRSFYPTPAWCVDCLLAEHPPPTELVIEPSAGEGAIAEVLAEMGHCVVAIEIRGECFASLKRALPESQGHVVHIDNWMRPDVMLPLPRKGGVPLSIVMNPPYDPPHEMLAHVERAVVDAGAQYIAALLPLRFLGSEDRLAFNQVHPPTAIYPLVPRPRFAEGGGSEEVAFFVWDRAPRPLEFVDQRVKVLHRGTRK